MAGPFTIGINLKPYVSRFLINKFGDPVDLYCKEGLVLRKFMISSLRNPEHKYDKQFCNDNFENETRFVISKSDFYQYGWEISKTEMVKFNSIIEHQIKVMCRMYISFDKSLGMKILTSAKNFQSEYGFTEQDFPIETIIKDFQRNSPLFKFNKTLIINSIKNKFIDTLSCF